ncbi:hypothetical protein BDW62DRAFT_196183 [Aspergillus aurantiobrunneus]
MPFKSHRPKPNLLIPSKRPLTSPRPSESRQTTTARSSSGSPPTLKIRGSAQTDRESNEDEIRKEPVEVDFSAAPQPFLDPALWERIKDRREWMDSD